MTAMRSVHPSLPHLLPPQASSSSSSPSSSSPLSGNSDLVLTGIYSLSRGANCLDSSAHARTGTISFPSLPADSELSTRERSDTAEHHTTKAHGSSSLKPFSPRDCLPTLSPPWEKQYRTWPPKPLAPHQSPSKVTVDSGTQILQAFTPDGAGTASRHLHTGDREVRRKRQADSSEISIASATGDVDEYSREEELANLGERMRLGATSTEDGGWSSAAWSASLIGSPGSDGRSQSGAHPEKSCQTSISPDPASFTQPLSATSPKIPCFTQYESMSLRDQLSAHGMAPWLQGQSRKRTLQDRTQFSDRDLYTLKRCWDSGMTSLGSVCREKIAAAALELSVDPEIIKTWIGNRRRKYRLMGIEIPPPKAGPITALGAERDPSSSDGCCESMPNGKSHSTPAKLVKTEQSEEEDEDDDDEDMLSTEMEHIQNLLEFKNEEVQFLEKELQNQKQRFSVLENFTKNLLIAVKNNDKKKQLELLDSLPHIQKDWNQECQDTGPSHIT